ncbi:MAG: hypothetical protein ABSB76_10500, partial [Streptosporangiaceae bacterium]
GKSTWSVILWLSPIVFVVWCVLAGLKSFRRADEYQQRVQLEAMAVGFGAVMITTTVFLLLESAPIKAPGALSSDPGGLVWAAGYLGWMGTIWFRSRAAR